MAAETSRGRRKVPAECRRLGEAGSRVPSEPPGTSSCPHLDFSLQTERPCVSAASSGLCGNASRQPEQTNAACERPDG